MMKQTKPKTSATRLKGVYNLNPTSMVMKLGSEKARRSVTQAPAKSKPTMKKRKSK